MADIHNRMPVILRPQDETEWLDKDANKDTVLGLLRPYSAEEMRAYKVDPVVGNVRNNNENLIKEVG